MNINDLNWTPSRRSLENHDYTVALLLDVLDWHRFRSLADGSNEVVILDATLDADRVVVQCSCATEEIRHRLQDAW